MRISYFLFSTLVAISLTGCSSSTDGSADTGFQRALREKFTGPTYETHVVHVDKAKAFAAAKAALTPMGFNFKSGGANQGKLSALNDITPATDVHAATQISLDVRLTEVDGGTEIGAVFTEITEDDFDRHPGMATSKQIDSPGIYENYFKHIDRALAPAK